MYRRWWFQSANKLFHATVPLKEIRLSTFTLIYIKNSSELALCTLCDREVTLFIGLIRSYKDLKWVCKTDSSELNILNCQFRIFEKIRRMYQNWL